MKTKIAFYKAKGTIFDKLIRLWTSSKYSHCEIIINDLWYSSSPRDNGVRAKYIPDYNKDNWDFIDIEIDLFQLDYIFYSNEGKGYDWLGIFLTQFIPLRIQSSEKMFCSEFCASVLKLNNPYVYNPKDLFKLLYNNQNNNKGV